MTLPSHSGMGNGAMLQARTSRKLGTACPGCISASSEVTWPWGLTPGDTRSSAVSRLSCCTCVCIQTMQTGIMSLELNSKQPCGALSCHSCQALIQHQLLGNHEGNWANQPLQGLVFLSRAVSLKREAPSYAHKLAKPSLHTML